MYCLTDFRNRPLLKYSFSSRNQAWEYLQKIKNNPLGATVIYHNGRSEYFENGLPHDFSCFQDKISATKKGFHIRYRLQKLSTIDSLRGGEVPAQANAAAKWKLTDSWQFFMLGNRKFYSCLAVLSVVFLSSAFLFQNKYGSAVFLGDGKSIDGIVLGASTEKALDQAPEDASASPDVLKLADEDVIFSLLSKIEEAKQDEFEKEILKYIKGRPMEKMAPYIAKQPRTVAAFIVGIAMKESKFGVYAPHSGGRDCFNYWGYKGRENTTASGYSCFNSPEHAIQVVGKKIASLVSRGISNPAEMISWKCGSTCAGHGAENVRKWISDVGIHFYKLNS